jgi:hypothetical protein
MDASGLRVTHRPALAAGRPCGGFTALAAGFTAQRRVDGCGGPAWASWAQRASPLPGPMRYMLPLWSAVSFWEDFSPPPGEKSSEKQARLPATVVTRSLLPKWPALPFLTESLPPPGKNSVKNRSGPPGGAAQPRTHASLTDAFVFALAFAFALGLDLAPARRPPLQSHEEPTVQPDLRAGSSRNWDNWVCDVAGLWGSWPA